MEYPNLVEMSKSKIHQKTCASKVLCASLATQLISGEKSFPEIFPGKGRKGWYAWFKQHLRCLSSLLLSIWLFQLLYDINGGGKNIRRMRIKKIIFKNMLFTYSFTGIPRISSSYVQRQMFFFFSPRRNIECTDIIYLHT